MYPLMDDQKDQYFDKYLTYRYDGTMERTTFYFDFEDLDIPVDYVIDQFDYTINENIIDYVDYENNYILLPEEIIQLTDVSLKIIRNCSTFIDPSKYYCSIIYMSRVNELPPIQ